MENHLVTEADLADAIEKIVAETSRGLRAARDRGVNVMMPSTMQISFSYLVEANAIGNTATREEPEATTTTVEQAGDTVSSETRGPVTTTSTVTDEPLVTTRTNQEGTQRSEQQDGGSDFISEINNWAEYPLA